MPNLFAHMDGLYAFTPSEIDTICSAGREIACSAGEVIVEKGRPGDSMFILLEGKAEIDLGFQNEIDLGLQNKIVVEGVGEYFGELSFLHPGHLRSATIRALSACTLCVLDQGVIDPLYRQYPAVLLNLFRRTCAFLIESEEQLLADLLQKNDELRQSYDYLCRTREELNYQEVLAQTDELTQLYNRRCMMEQLDRGIGEGPATPHRLGLLMVDLDRFKSVNDLYGHAAGDEILRQVADVVKQCIRTEDLPCRYGGDELAVLLHGVERMPGDQRGEEIRASIEALPPVRPGAPRISVSIGGALCRDGDSAASLLARADAALYQAKSEGRNRVVWRT